MNPFDAISSTYDGAFSDTLVGRYQRAVVTEIIERRFLPGMRVLEIGCGAGTDTLFLAKRGVSVIAIDASAAMVEMTRRRIEEAGMQERVAVSVCAVEQFAGVTDKLFDGILSNFGALNCVTDLDIICPALMRRLKPGGYAALCLMGRWCAWEIFAHAARLRLRIAFRRLGRNGADIHVGDGFVHVIYPSVRRLTGICAPYCAHVSTTGVGILIPPPYLESLVQRFPQTFQSLWRIERAINRLWPFNRFGDHYCVELQRTMS